MMIELTNTEVLKDLVFLDLETGYYDLHNDYECSTINLSEVDNSLKILFEPRVKQRDKICLLFKNVSIKKINFFLNKTSDSATIDTIYRGRFESGTGLHEYSASGQSYFYIEFEQGDAIELFAGKLFFLLI